MHIRMTLTEGVSNIDRVADVLRDEVVPALREMKGFRGMTASVDRAAGVVGILTLWDSEADLTASDSAVGQLRENTIKDIGGRLVEVRAYEELVSEMGDAPPAVGCPLLITPTRMDPAKIDENAAFFRETVLPDMKSVPGFRAVRNMVDRQTGEGRVGMVLADGSAVEAARVRAAERRQMAASRGVELGEMSQREIIFMLMV